MRPTNYLQGYPFQVGYCETTSTTAAQQQAAEQQLLGEGQHLVGRAVPQYTLYVIANSAKERSEWIRAIRQGKH